MFECSVAKTIIGGTLVAVLEDVVGLVDFLESMLAVAVARIAVRVMLHRKLAKCSLELDLGAAAANAQDLVVVALGHPDCALVHHAETGVLDSATAGPCKHAPPDECPGVTSRMDSLRMARALQSGGFLLVVVDLSELRVNHVFFFLARGLTAGTRRALSFLLLLVHGFAQLHRSLRQRIGLGLNGGR